MPGAVLWPVPPELRIITTDYGGATDYEAFHQGIDLGIPVGTSLRAPISGLAFHDYTDTSGSILWIIDVSGKTGLAIRLCHLSEYKVVNGQQVAMGDVVALSGSTGAWVTGPHLHLEVWQNNTLYKVRPYCYNEQVIQLLWSSGNDYNRIDPMQVLDDVGIPIIPTEIIHDKVWVGVPKVDTTEHTRTFSRDSSKGNKASNDDQFDIFLPVTTHEEKLLKDGVSEPALMGGLSNFGPITVAIVVALTVGIGAVFAFLGYKKRK